VPPALVDGGISGTVVVVQPRQVAARMAARRIAAERGGRVGGEVGYTVRFDRQVSRDTRIEVVTEGVLVRRLLDDPFLESVGAVVLDEFHERSLDGDLALALIRALRGLGRDDLAVVVMSATLDPGPVAAFLDDAPVIVAEGRTFPVEIRYDPRAIEHDPAARVPEAVREALRATGEGHVLAFLPGVGEIERAADALADVGVPVLPLHGRLPPEAQDRALAPSSERKVVLATNVAETSVTLAGVRAVVDCGLEKTAWFDPALGITRLERGPISRASADQRAGRAGRTGPGWCRRLWTEADHRRRQDAVTPEIRRADLAETSLLLRVWGTPPDAVRWFEAPDPAALARADWLLERVGALSGGALTPLGRTLARFPVHPRLARVVVEAHGAGFLTDAASVAALAEEADPFEHADRLPPGDDDLERRLVGLDDPRRAGAHPGRVARVRQVRDQLVGVARRVLGAPGRDGASDPAGRRRALLAGFPDRVGRQGQGRRYKLAEGGGVELDPSSAAVGAPWILAVTVEAGARRERQVGWVRSAVPLSLSDVAFDEVVETRFDAERQAVVTVTVRRYGDLVLDEAPAKGGDPVDVARTLAEAAARDPQRALTLDEEVATWLGRVDVLRRAMPELGLPALDPVAMLPDLCVGQRSFADLRRIDLVAAMGERLSWAQRQALDAHAPDRMPVPSGSSVRLRYAIGEPPVLAARVQQMFGMRETPTVASGRVKVLVHLLAPNQRPVQVTQDLAGFWSRTWPEVRKDLRGRYPRHAWPEDPWTAIPEDRPQRRRG